MAKHGACVSGGVVWWGRFTTRSFLNPGTYGWIVATRGVILHTADGGHTWSTQWRAAALSPSPFTDAGGFHDPLQSLLDVDVYSTLGTVLVVAVGDSGATVRSADLGATWHIAAAKTSASLAHVHVVDEQVRALPIASPSLCFMVVSWATAAAMARPEHEGAAAASSGGVVLHGVGCYVGAGVGLVGVVGWSSSLRTSCAVSLSAGEEGGPGKLLLGKSSCAGHDGSVLSVV